MDKKTFAYGFLAYFIFMTIYLYNNNDYIAQIIAQNGLIGIFWYFFTNASYVLILVSILALNREVSFFKNLIGGLFIIFAIDIVGFIRFSPTGLSKDLMLLASSDGIIINNLLNLGLTYSTIYFLYYLILPIALIIGAVSILGITDFFRRLING